MPSPIILISFINFHCVSNNDAIIHMAADKCGTFRIIKLKTLIINLMYLHYCFHIHHQLNAIFH